MKRTIAIILAAALVFSLGAAAAYADVDPSTEQGKAIEALSALGILGGFEDGTFMPGSTITREQFAKIIYIYKTGLDQAEAGDTGFSDVDAGRWSAGFIKWAADNKIVGGMGDGAFAPENRLTMAQAIKMLVVADGGDDTLAYPDGFIEEARSRGYLKNISSFSANYEASRGTVALLTYNALSAGGGKSSGVILSLGDNQITFASCDENGRGRVPSQVEDRESPTVLLGVATTYDIDESSVATYAVAQNCAVTIVEGGYSAGVSASAGRTASFAELKASDEQNYYSAIYSLSGGEVTEIIAFSEGRSKSCYEKYDSLVAIPLNIPVVINPGGTSIVNIWYGPQANPRDLDFGMPLLTQPILGAIDFSATHPASFWLLRYTQEEDAKVGDRTSFTYTLRMTDNSLDATGVVNIELVEPTMVPDKTFVVDVGSISTLDANELFKDVEYNKYAPNPNETEMFYIVENGEYVTGRRVATAEGGTIIRNSGNAITYTAPDHLCEDIIPAAFFDGWDYTLFNIHIIVLD